MSETYSTESSAASLIADKSKQITEMVAANPVPAVLSAAAVGAGLMALIALMAKPSFRLPPMPQLPKAITDVDLGSLKSQLADLIDKAKDAFPKKEVTEKAADASEAVQDSWQDVRDRASDLIDQVQPQLDAGIKVARDNPLWAALIVGAVGTALGAQFLGRSR
jgi:ElaB/YqjD/DUF883 family membrane-anchored ribosome-binding protein